jgi:hypothetical protein
MPLAAMKLVVVAEEEESAGPRFSDSCGDIIRAVGGPPGAPPVADGSAIGATETTGVTVGGMLEGADVGIMDGVDVERLEGEVEGVVFEGGLVAAARIENTSMPI